MEPRRQPAVEGTACLHAAGQRYRPSSCSQDPNTFNACTAQWPRRSPCCTRQPPSRALWLTQLPRGSSLK